jgi:hypothetical protein
MSLQSMAGLRFRHLRFPFAKGHGRPLAAFVFGL